MNHSHTLAHTPLLTHTCTDTNTRAHIRTRMHTHAHTRTRLLFRAHATHQAVPQEDVGGLHRWSSGHRDLGVRAVPAAGEA